MPKIKPTEKESSPYFVLWNREHGLPKYIHASYSSALIEARRLANKFPGSKFRILKSVSSVIVENNAP